MSFNMIARLFLASGGLSLAVALYYVVGLLRIGEAFGPGDIAGEWKDMQKARIKVWSTSGLGALMVSGLLLVAARLF